MTREELLAIFAEDVPPGFLRDMVAMLHRVYPESYHEQYSRRSPYEARDTLGINRRADIEGYIREIAARYPGVTTYVRTNRKLSQYYTEIQCGRVVMTQSRLAYQWNVVRPAGFRSELNICGQLPLEGFEDERYHEPGTIYAVLAHGPQVAVRDEKVTFEGGPPQLDWSDLGFAFVGFPGEEMRSWAARIDLLASVGRTVDRNDIEQIDDRIALQLRPKPRADETRA